MKRNRYLWMAVSLALATWGHVELRAQQIPTLDIPTPPWVTVPTVFNNIDAFGNISSGYINGVYNNPLFPPPPPTLTANVTMSSPYPIELFNGDGSVKGWQYTWTISNTSAVTTGGDFDAYTGPVPPPFLLSAPLIPGASQTFSGLYGGPPVIGYWGGVMGGPGPGVVGALDSTLGPMDDQDVGGAEDYVPTPEPTIIAQSCGMGAMAFFAYVWVWRRRRAKA
jgi:hypothetical protein